MSGFAFKGDVGSDSIPGMKAAVAASGIPIGVSSGFRPSPDYHGSHNATDWSNSPGQSGSVQEDQLAGWLAANYGTVSLEIIHVNLDGSSVTWKDGAPVDPSFYGGATMAQHHNHTHWAITNSGLTARGAPSAAGQADLSGSGGGPIPSFIPGADQLNAILGAADTIDKFVAHLLNPSLWIRLGKGGAGLLVVAIAVVLIHRSMS